MSQLAGRRMWEDHDGIRSHIEGDQPERQGSQFLPVGMIGRAGGTQQEQRDID